MAQSAHLGVSVGTTAFIPVKADAIVIVAHHGGDMPLTDQLDHFVRIGTVAHQVAQTVDLIGN